jgi:colicin import membrane protein
MPASTDRLQFAPPPPPGMLRALGFAVIAHLLLMLALGWGVNWKRDPVPLSAEAELWSTLPQEAAPKLVEPAPVPPPPVPAPPPVVNVEPPKPEPAPREAEIAVEREKEKQAEARRKQLALEKQKREAEKQKQLEAKRELEERRKQELAKAKAAEDRQKQETAKRSKADEQRIEAQRQANLERMKGMAGATGAPTATGTALRASGQSDAYGGRVAARVKPNIVFNEELAGNPRAEVEVRTAPDGTIVGQRIVKSSGVRSWDEAVLKAVIKTEVLPRDVDGRVPSSLIIGFRPKD